MLPGLLRNHRRVLTASAVAAILLSCLSIALVDGRLAITLASLPDGARPQIQRTVTFVEMLFGFPISPYLYGAILLAAGFATLPVRRRTLVPWALLFLASTHLTARFAVDILKPPFSRLRPFEALGEGGWHDTWFAPVGNSFPSGHAVHFWGLFFPLIVLCPRWTPAFVMLPLLVSAARVAVNDHYLSDVIASAAIAALVTLGYAVLLLERGQAAVTLSHGPSGSSSNPTAGGRSPA